MPWLWSRTHLKAVICYRYPLGKDTFVYILKQYIYICVYINFLLAVCPFLASCKLVLELVKPESYSFYVYIYLLDKADSDSCSPCASEFTHQIPLASICHCFLFCVVKAQWSSVIGLFRFGIFCQWQHTDFLTHKKYIPEWNPKTCCKRTFAIQWSSLMVWSVTLLFFIPKTVEKNRFYLSERTENCKTVVLLL